MFAKGTKVRQKMPTPIEGVVTHFDVDQEKGNVQLHVAWTDTDGKEHGTYFLEHELEEVSPAPAQE